MTDQPTLTEIDPAAELSEMQRLGNRELMVFFINYDLINRAALDVRKSYVLYDGDKGFMYAVSDLPDDEMMRSLRATTAIRYWSKGI